jgi:hypothetical protein
VAVLVWLDMDLVADCGQTRPSQGERLDSLAGAA